jgi:hypothetical protein
MYKSRESLFFHLILSISNWMRSIDKNYVLSIEHPSELFRCDGINASIPGGLSRIVAF